MNNRMVMNTRFFKIFGLICLVLAAFCLYSKFSSKDDPDAIKIEDTPAVIESTRPIGVLYLYTAVVEEYANDAFYGSGIGSSLLGKGNGVLKRKHSCVQILKQQVNLTMDMNSVKYEPIANTDTVIVSLPDVDFSQSTIGSWFKSDSESEERAVEYDSKPLIERVERKIESKYNTIDNRNKARQQAENVLSEFLQREGKIAVFN